MQEIQLLLINSIEWMIKFMFRIVMILFICYMFSIVINQGGFDMEWQSCLEIFGLIGGIATVFGVMMAPMFYIGAKIEGIREELHSFKDEMHKEHKDFHGKLCALEEKSRSSKTK